MLPFGDARRVGLAHAVRARRADDLPRAADRAPPRARRRATRTSPRAPTSCAAGSATSSTRGTAAGSCCSASAAFLTSVFSAPSSQLMNKYLTDVRGFSNTGIALFRTVTTAVPGLDRPAARRPARRGARPPARRRDRARDRDGDADGVLPHRRLDHLGDVGGLGPHGRRGRHRARHARRRAVPHRGAVDVERAAHDRRRARLGARADRWPARSRIRSATSAARSRSPASARCSRPRSSSSRASRVGARTLDDVSTTSRPHRGSTVPTRDARTTDSRPRRPRVSRRPALARRPALVLRPARQARRRDGRRRHSRRRSSRCRSSRRGSAGCPTAGCSSSRCSTAACCASKPTARSRCTPTSPTLAPGTCNDMVVDATGRAYVGNFGFDMYGGAKAHATRASSRSSPTARRASPPTDSRFPNGTVITPDGATLIVGESMARRITAFDIAADGSLSNQRVWAKLEGATVDGMCLDAEGAVWVACPFTGRVLRIARGRRGARRGQGHAPRRVRVHARRRRPPHALHLHRADPRSRRGRVAARRGRIEAVDGRRAGRGTARRSAPGA